MFRRVLIVALLAAMLAPGLPTAVSIATAQPAATDSEPAADPGDDTPEAQRARWVRVLDRVDAQLKEDDVSLAVLSILDQTVDDVRGQLATARQPVQIEVDRIGDLVEALGPPPGEGEPPEPESIAAERRDLNQLLSVPEATLRRLDVLSRRVNLLSGSIADAQASVLKAQLLVRTPSLLSFETWSRAASEFRTLGRRILTSPTEWFQSPRVSGTVGTGYLVGLFLAVLAAAVLGWSLRRWLIRNFGRKPSVEDPNFRTRVLASVAEATGTTLVPILVVLAAYGALLSRDLLFGVFQSLAIGIVAAVAWASALRGLPRAMLSPEMPHWRLTRMGDQAARLWDRRALALAIIIGIDRLIAYPLEALEPSLLLNFTYAFIGDGAMAIVVLSVVVDKRLWRTAEEEAGLITTAVEEETEPSPDEDAGRSQWWLVGRVLFAALAAAILITAVAGYGVLSDHIARRLAASVGVFLVALVLHGLARDLVAVFTREDEKPPASGMPANPIYVWSVLLLDVVLVLSIVFFMVSLWGGRWETIVERIGWVMSGLKIGGRTFSPADVLTGIVVFIILIIVVRLFQRFLDVRVLRQTRMDIGVRDALKTGIGYAGVVIAALVAVNTAGIDLSGLAIIAGALSVGIGFGMQSIVNNFVSGLILLIERPIKVGDWVVVGQDEGLVKRISVRSTEIQTFSNASVIVPNSELIAGRVTNWMFKDRSGRVEVPVGVAYGSDTAKVRDILLDCVRGRSGTKAWPPPTVVFTEFGDSALLFQLRFHIQDVENRLMIASDVRFAIDAAFRDAGISIPFPQRDVHIVKAGEPTTPNPARTGTSEAPVVREGSTSG